MYVQSDSFIPHHLTPFQLFEVPSNLVIKKLKPSRYIATITVLWGIIATLTGITQKYADLIAVRLLLGPPPRPLSF